MATNRAGDEPIQARAGNDRTFAGHDVQECQPVGLEIAARGSGQTDGAYDAAGPQASAAAKKIQTSILLARIGLYENVNDSVAKLDERDDLSRAEHYLRGTLSGQNGWSTINTLMSGAVGCHYSFATMAMDDVAFTGRTVPRLLLAAWSAARVAGPWWWPLTHSVVLSDGPVEMHLNEKLLLHQGDGPAMVYRDGVRIWAWNGRAMREEWIMHPETISARDLKEFDPSFREYAAVRTKSAGPVVKVKPSPILKQQLPANPEERAAILRRHNQGALPIFERYAGGNTKKPGTN